MLADFGFATFATAEVPLHKLCGTPEFVAPEASITPSWRLLACWRTSLISLAVWLSSHRLRSELVS